MFLAVQLKLYGYHSGQGSKSSQAKPINPPVQKKPAAYQPPHAKAKAAKEAEV